MIPNRGCNYLSMSNPLRADAWETYFLSYWNNLEHISYISNKGDNQAYPNYPYMFYTHRYIYHPQKWTIDVFICIFARWYMKYITSCVFNHLFHRRSTKTSKLRVTVLSCDQAALQMVFSVFPSVRHTFLTMFPSPYHHEIFRIYYQWPT